MIDQLKDRFRLGIKFLRYYFTAMNGKGHGMHSPFGFDFIVHVLDRKKYTDPGFIQIESIRTQLSQSNQVLEVHDLGAGSKTNALALRSVGSIARSAAKPAKYARLLYRIIRHYKIDHVLELGTSLGLTTRYLKLANPPSGVITIEGATVIADFTREQWQNEGITNIDLRVGNFDECLGPALETMHGKKMIFIDGNHDQAATLRYFETILDYISDGDILVFDDIRWSTGMEKAWQEIIKCKEVTCTIDLFFVGIVLFRKEFKEKLDFVIRF